MFRFVSLLCATILGMAGVAHADTVRLAVTSPLKTSGLTNALIPAMAGDLDIKVELHVASLGKARTMMAKQTGLVGKTILNLRPTYLVVPSGLELTAEQLIAQSLVPAKTTDVVPNSIRSLAVIAEPRLDPAAGAVPWYLFANPASIDTIEYAYLEGQDGVAIESRMGFDVDGVEIRARLDFGAKAIDWRGMLKNAGVTLS